jgi:hypothetical protein
MRHSLRLPLSGALILVTAIVLALFGPANAAAQGTKFPIVADIGGQTLTPGVYNSGSSIGLTGTVTLDGRGNANAVFVFQAGSTLTTASASQVKLINGTQACNVFWQVGSSATLGTFSSFRGSILALTSITVTTGVTVEGRLHAQNGAVTLDTNTITKPTRAAGTAASLVPLGTADSFAVLAGSAITNTGPTTVNGDLGTYPTPTITGTATLIMNGTNHGGDAVTQQAKTDLVTAYNNAATTTTEAMTTSAPTTPTAGTLDATTPSQNYSVHLADNTIPAGIICPVFDPAGVCGQVLFTLTSGGTVTATAVFPIDAQVDLELCQVQSVDVTLDNCPRGTAIVCTTAQAVNPDGTTFTQTITCPVTASGQYELLLVPVFVATCPIVIDPLAAPCEVGPGIDVTGTITFGVGGDGTGTGGTPPPTFIDAEVKGGGQLGPKEKFSLKAETDSWEWDERHHSGRVRYQNDGVCKFRSKSLTLVQVTFDTATHRGTFHIEGNGVINNNTAISFKLDGTGHGEGADNSGDTFRLKAGSCSNSNTKVVKGDIKIEPKHELHHD